MKTEKQLLTEIAKLQEELKQYNSGYFYLVDIHAMWKNGGGVQGGYNGLKNLTSFENHIEEINTWDQEDLYIEHLSIYSNDPNTKSSYKLLGRNLKTITLYSNENDIPNFWD